MKIEINKPIYEYCLKDLIKKAELNPKHQETDSTDILTFNIVEGATFAGRLGTTVYYLTEVQLVVREALIP